MGIELTDEQKELVRRLVDWYKKGDKLYFSFTGGAGTGKTTTVKAFIDELGISRYRACAYVGKAVNMLARQGLVATTIHSMIYNIAWVPKRENGYVILNSKGKPTMTLEFILKKKIEGNPQLLIVDEATMVNDELCKDILSFQIPTVFLGDMNQLPPVFGISSIMKNPDYRLTRIMRQAEGNPIIYLSQQILKGIDLKPGDYGNSRVVRGYRIDPGSLQYDTIISGRNRTRDFVNWYVRKKLLDLPDKPQVGDKIICKQNDWARSIKGNLYLTTGMCGKITEINKSSWNDKYVLIDFQPDFVSDAEFTDLMLDTKYIGLDYGGRNKYGFSEYEKFEFAYAVTVHSMQGSQSPSVLYLDQWFHDADMVKKLRYTAITRAVDHITYAQDYRIPYEYMDLFYNDKVA